MTKGLEKWKKKQEQKAPVCLIYTKIKFKSTLKISYGKRDF